MFRLIGWLSIALGVVTLLGSSKVIKGWELNLSFSVTDTGGQLFLFIIGLFLLICGILEVTRSR